MGGQKPAHPTGLAKIIDTLTSTSSDVRILVNTLSNEINEFCGMHPKSDDITIFSSSHALRGNSCHPRLRCETWRSTPGLRSHAARGNERIVEINSI